MAKIIAITNQKGGVGKTTTSINLAASLALLERTVLLIDMDPQGNATMGSGINKQKIETSITDVLLDDAAVSTVMQTTPAGYELVPANSDLTAAEVKLLHVSMRERRLAHALAKVRERYDYILLDCPPALNMLTINALVAADSVLIPIQCEYYALEGLTSLLETIDKMRRTVNPKLRIEGLLRTMFDGRNSLANQVSEQLHRHFNKQLYTTIIPRNVRLAEAPSHGLPVVLYDKYSSGALAYQTLAKEIIEHREHELYA
jgi:chromosome partitioning protein